MTEEIKEEVKEEKKVTRKPKSNKAPGFVEIPKEELDKLPRVKKCQYRASKAMGVSLEHLALASKELNGRKIDGIFYNDLLGRYGYYDGFPYNRADLAKKYDTSVVSVELAEEKLVAILAKKDVKKAYVAYMDEYKKSVEKDIDEETVIGG